MTTHVTVHGNWIPTIPAGMTGEQLQTVKIKMRLRFFTIPLHGGEEIAEARVA